jgi:hypothetical protein
VLKELKVLKEPVKELKVLQVHEVLKEIKVLQV